MINHAINQVKYFNRLTALIYIYIYILMYVYIGIYNIYIYICRLGGATRAAGRG